VKNGLLRGISVSRGDLENGRHSVKSQSDPPHIGQRVGIRLAIAP
jgi:hypothetical protein